MLGPNCSGWAVSIWPFTSDRERAHSAESNFRGREGSSSTSDNCQRSRDESHTFYVLVCKVGILSFIWRFAETSSVVLSLFLGFSNSVVITMWVMGESPTGHLSVPFLTSRQAALLRRRHRCLFWREQGREQIFPVGDKRARVKGTPSILSPKNPTNVSAHIRSSSTNFGKLETFDPYHSLQAQCD